MRASKRIVYTPIVHSTNWLESQGSEEIEEYPGELSLTWWKREIPPFIMLVLLTLMLGKIFGMYFILILIVITVPVLVISGLLMVFDSHY